MLISPNLLTTKRFERFSSAYRKKPLQTNCQRANLPVMLPPEDAYVSSVGNILRRTAADACGPCAGDNASCARSFRRQKREKAGA